MEHLILPRWDFWLCREEGVWFDHDSMMCQADKGYYYEFNEKVWNIYQGYLKYIKVPAAYCDGE